MFEFLASVFSGAFGSVLAFFAGKKALIPSAKDELEDLITLANNSTDAEVKDALYLRAAKVASNYGKRRLLDLVLSMAHYAVVVMLVMTVFALFAFIVTACAAVYASYHLNAADSITIAGSCIEYFKLTGIVLVSFGLFKVIAWHMAERSMSK